MINMHMVTPQARLLRPLASVLLAAAMCVPTVAAADGAGKADANFPSADQAKSYFAEGVNQYRAGRFKDAALSLRNAIAAEPDNKLVYEFYLACGDALIVRMQDQDVLDDVLKDILRRARIYQRQLRVDPAYIDLLITKLDKSEEERVVATNELAAVGPLAVPRLVVAMSDNPQEERRTHCRVVLTKMGGRAILPLITALASKDQRQIRSIALVLGDIGDARALPALLRTKAREGHEGTTTQVLDSAIAAVASRAQIADVGQPEALHLAEAIRYFRGGPEVRDDQAGAGSLLWRWDESQEGAAKLQSVRAPGYAWNELVAEEILIQGLAAYPKFEAFNPVLAAVYAAQQTEVELRAALAAERTVPVGVPEDATDAIAERVLAVAEAGNRINMVGADNLCRAVQQAITSGRYDVAATLMRHLETRDIAHPADLLPTPDQGLNPEKPGSVLIAALEHPEKIVRYQAAITLASIDPVARSLDLGKLKTLADQLDDSIKKDTEKRSQELSAELQKTLEGLAIHGFYGAEKVVPVLAQAVGEWGVRVVLVVDQDYRQRNAARAALQSKGYVVITAADGFEAINRLAEAPVKDAVVIAGDLAPSLKDEHGSLIDSPKQTALGLVTLLANDPRLGGSPIFVALPDSPEKASEIQTAFEGKIPQSGGLVAKPFDAAELNDKIDAALKATASERANQSQAESIALRAAIALQRPDVLRTDLGLAQAADALVSTLDARADPLRIEALKALGHIAQAKDGASLKGYAARLTDIYGSQDAELEKNPQLRAAFLYAIGQIDPTTEAAGRIIAKALAHSDAGVRAAAAVAVGASSAVPAEVLSAYQIQQRLDARAAGAGKN